MLESSFSFFADILLSSSFSSSCLFDSIMLPNISESAQFLSNDVNRLLTFCKLSGSFSNEFILLNSIMALKLLFCVNGVLLIDYFVSLRKSKAARIINWFLLFILFAYISEIIAIIGFIDVFLNFRRKARIA